MPDSLRDEQVPVGGKIACMFVSLTGLSIIAICTLRRVQDVKISTQLPLTFFLVVAIYSSSFLFVFLTAVYRDVGVNESVARCDAAIILCLSLYLVTKICIYFFLVERVHIVRGSRAPRMKDKLYVVNTFGMLIPYMAIFVLNVVYRFAYFNADGTCIVGVRKPGLVPLISFDVAVNVYLTVLFLTALRRLYSYRGGRSAALRNVGFRSFVGACMTLIVTIINLMILVLMDGEPSWICTMSCNLDVILGVCVIHWITKTDRTQLSPYHQRTQTCPPKPWFKLPYASNESDGSCENGDTNPQQAGGQRKVSFSNAEQKRCTCIPAAFTAPKRPSSIDLDRIMISTRPNEQELDGETLGAQGESTESMSVRGILHDTRSYP